MAQQRFINRPLVSVIIPTLNEAGYVSGVLADLYHQTRQPDQILVVDGQSVDKTPVLIGVWARKWPLVQLVSCPTRGVGTQRDVGGKAAMAKRASIGETNRPHLLYFLDADVRLHPDFVERTLAIQEQFSLDAACPQYIPATTTLSNPIQQLLVKGLFAILNFLFWFGQKQFPAGAGPCIMVTTELFQKLNGFNPQLLVDDLDFVHRAGRTGKFQIMNVPVIVSTRRFQKYGFWPTCWSYLLISWHFIKKDTTRTNALSYEFGKFSK